jgi:hypothetical protein
MRALMPFLAFIAFVTLAGCAESSGDSTNMQHDSGLGPDADSTCVYEGETYASGDIVYKSRGVSCICEDDGRFDRCTGALDDPDTGDETECVDNGTHYAVGDVIPRGVGSSCLCLPGGEVGRCASAEP